MRGASLSLTALVSVLLIQTGWLARADEKSRPASAELIYPANVAMSEEPPKGMIFRQFPTGQRLYVYDKDSPGKSVCNEGCEAAWPALIALPGSKPLGDWTLITRYDGRKQ